jgi:uncharacterized protein (TIGR02265 family)
VTLSPVDVGEVRQTLGLARRIADVPPHAHIRGVWFSLAANHVRRLGLADALAWRSLVAQRSRIPFLSYSLREYLEELAIAAALVNTRNPAEGIRSIWRGATPMYLATPLGRSLLRLLQPNPVRYLSWLADHRDHFCNTGKWTVTKHADTYVTLEMQDEYIWLESAHRGGCEGLLVALGVTGSVEAECTNGPYAGRLHIRWTPHAS